MFTQFNLYHVDITGLPHLHVFAPQREIADVLIQAYLITKGFENRSYAIHDAAPHNLSLLEREHLQMACAQDVSGLGVYDSEDGWEIFSVFDYPA
jgi:hypothetical protein